jgi:hypothetical protein
MSIHANPNRTLCITAIATFALALMYGLCFAQAGKGARAATPAGPGMQKVVTQHWAGNVRTTARGPLSPGIPAATPSYRATSTFSPRR